MNSITIPCPFCQKRIPFNSSRCPECQAELPAEFGVAERNKVLLFGLVFTGLIIVAIGFLLFYYALQLLTG